MEWVPCFLWLARRVWLAPSLKGGLAAGVVLVLVAFCDLYYLVSCFVIVGLALVWLLWRDWRRLQERALQLALGVGAGVFLLVGGPLVLAVGLAFLGGELAPGHDSVYWAADLQAFFVPNWISAWGESFASISQRWTGNPAENSQYVGTTVLGLGVLGISLRPRGERPWAWAALLGLGFLLALGPALHWGGQILRNVPLPFALVEKLLPVLKLSGAPTRWCFLTVTASSVLAGLGLSVLMERVGDRRLGKVKLEWAVGLGCLALVLLELAPRFVEIRPFRQPSFVTALAEDPRPGAV
jgi:hypothetical protein